MELSKIKRNYILVILSFILLACTIDTNMFTYYFTNKSDELDIIRQREQAIKFNYVFNRFKYYNENIDSSTVKKFIEVVEYFKLDKTKQMFDLCIAQICVESRSRQYNDDGTLVESSGNAIGIAQITPTTAFQYLKNIAGMDNKLVFDALGATNYDFLLSKDIISKNDSVGENLARNKTKKWLKNVNNNLILWGFIMKYTLNCDHNIINALVAYNMGGNGLSSYLRQGKNVTEHAYIIMINTTINVLDDIDI